MGKLALCIGFVAFACYVYQGNAVNPENVFSSMARSTVSSIEFTVYNRETYSTGQKIEITTASVNSFRNFRSNTVVIIHDHNGSGRSGPNPTLKNAFLTNDDVTVIVVDWSLIANLDYYVVIGHVPNVGEHIASLIRLLVARNQVNLGRLHLVGFGVGAHVAGYVSRALNNQVARITGLDPTGTAWGANTGRLRNDDALYVEVIHSDVPTDTNTDAIGVGTAIGQVNFYPNGGYLNPGCATDDHDCQHNRAWQFFAATLTDGGLIGSQCKRADGSAGDITQTDITFNNCDGYTVAMGGNDLIKYAEGVYYLETSRAYPYKENCLSLCSTAGGQ